jgi:hypothetical protein
VRRLRRFVNILELQKRKLLESNEAEWRLDSRTLWWACEDENTNKIHHYENHRRNVNTIWMMRNGEGEEANSFEDLGKLELEHFGDVCKEDSKATIVQVVKMTTFFPSFVNDMSNESLMEEVASIAQLSKK